MKFIIASNNPHKITELSRILTRLGIEAASPRELGLSLGEVEETGSTFAENARIKAEHAERLSGLPAIADDSGLAVDALGGAPGIYSARYAGENATDSERMDKLLGELKDVDAPRRGAKFVSAICVCFRPGASSRWRASAKAPSLSRSRARAALAMTRSSSVRAAALRR